MVLLETYSSLPVEELKNSLPPFLRDVVDVTGKPEYSMFNLSLRDESYDAKFYKYAAHGNKQLPPTSLSSPLKDTNGHCHNNKNGTQNRTPASSPLLSPVMSSSPSSDDVLIALTSSAIKRAATASNGHGNGVTASAVAPLCCLNNGLNGSSSNGNESVNGSKNGGGCAMNGAANGKPVSVHVHVD